MRNQKGFSGLETFLVLVIIAFMAYVGWYVYSVRQESNKTYNQVDQTASTSAAKPSDPTAKWKAYSSAAGKYSLKYPETWVAAGNTSACTSELLLLGADNNSVGKCGADGPGAAGQMQISSTDGDYRTLDEMKDGSGFKDVSKKTVKVAAADGVRYEGTTSGQQSDFGGGFPDGIKEIGYVFYVNNRTYTATYIQQSGYKNVEADFDLMVTKTLKFQP